MYPKINYFNSTIFNSLSMSTNNYSDKFITIVICDIKNM